MKICAFTGGGTAGHIYPGLAIISELKSLDSSLSFVWIGSSRGMDKKIVEESKLEKSLFTESNYANDMNGANAADSVNGAKEMPLVNNFEGIVSGKLRRYFSFNNFLDGFKVFFGFLQSIYILRKYKPLFLFSKGGFVSVPPCFAARLLKIPVYTHECDFSPGLATKLNAKFADKIFLSYQETKAFFPQKIQNSLLVFGNPVRPVFYTAEKNRGYDFLFNNKEDLKKIHKTKPILLVLGGSLGAAQINTLVYENLEWLCSHCIVVHQRGKNDLSKKTHPHYLPYEFIYSEMPHVLAASDILLSRSGANSLSEALVLEKPIILVPLMGSGTRGDQVENAEYLEKHGAAKLLLGDTVNSKNLQKAVLFFLEKENRKQYENNIRKIQANEKPAKKIAEYLLAEYLGKKGETKCSMD